MDTLRIKVEIEPKVSEEGIEKIIRTIGKKYDVSALEGIQSIFYLTPSKDVDVDKAIEYINSIPGVYDVSRYYG